MKFFYYSRVSTVEQNSARQIANFKTHGHVSNDNVFIDKIQGNVHFFQREAAANLFNAITKIKDESTTLVIDSIDRIGRDLIDILNTIKIFTDNKINVKSLKEGFETLLPDGKENAMARIVVSVMGSIAQMERERIKLRQKEGIAVAKAIGTYKGRKVGSSQTRERLLERHPVIVKKLNEGLKVRDIAAITKNSTTTVIKIKKALKLKAA